MQTILIRDTIGSNIASMVGVLTEQVELHLAYCQTFASVVGVLTDQMESELQTTNNDHFLIIVF